MILRTDTIGKVENPKEDDIKKAICYADGKKAHVGDFVNLLTDLEYDGDYLSLSLNTKKVGHSVTIRICDNKMVCTQNFDNETSISLMIRHLREDFSWINEYEWKNPIINVLIENLIKLGKQNGSTT